MGQDTRTFISATSHSRGSVANWDIVVGNFKPSLSSFRFLSILEGISQRPNYYHTSKPSALPSLLSSSKASPLLPLPPPPSVLLPSKGGENLLPPSVTRPTPLQISYCKKNVTVVKKNYFYRIGVLCCQHQGGADLLDLRSPY